MQQCPISGCEHKVTNDHLEEYGYCSYCKNNKNWIYLIVDKNDGTIKYGRTSRYLLDRVVEHSDVKGGDPMEVIDAFQVSKKDLSEFEDIIRQLINSLNIKPLPNTREWFHPGHYISIKTIFENVKKLAGYLIPEKKSKSSKNKSSSSRK